MPANPRPAKSHRKPGILYRLISKSQVGQAPPWFKTFARNLDDSLQKIWMALDNSLPAPHGATHRGGRDNIAGTEVPAPVVAGGEGDPGTPQSGFAPIDHVHALDLGPILPDLPELIPGSPQPPFRTLQEQLDYHNAVAAAQDAYKPILICMYR